MKIYLVGGAVRDKLLNLPIKEKDWVVVGATVDDMLKQGFKQVGKEFPVFLHPKTNEEYALARMERKIHSGYKGFSFDTSKNVTLEADLMRRDLTINAMAESETGELIDPYHGKEDLLKYKLLRHVSPHFAEDPVRILRVGRFLARYFHRGFRVADETYELMRKMVKAGEVNALVAERVFKELERALHEKNPEQFFIVLENCGALAILFPDLNLKNPGFLALQLAPTSRIRFAALVHDFPNPKESIAALCRRYRLPNAYRELAMLTGLHYQTALAAKKLSTDELLQLLHAFDVYRRETRFHDFLEALKAIAKARGVEADTDWLRGLVSIVKSVDVQALLAKGLSGQALAKTLMEKRRERIKTYCR